MAAKALDKDAVRTGLLVLLTTAILAVVVVVGMVAGIGCV